MSFEIIVVDNDSNDGSQQLVYEFAQKYNFITPVISGVNRGVAGGRNIGYKRASGRYILSIDDDILIGWPDIKGLLRPFYEMDRVGAVSPRIKGPDGYQFDLGEKQRRIAVFHGACRMYSQKVLGEVGLLDEKCEFGAEEFDHCVRIYASGYKIVYVPWSTVKHDNIVATGLEKKERTKSRVYNFTRVNFKHFASLRAGLYSGRYLAPRAVRGLAKGDFEYLVALAIHAMKGMVEGRREHDKVPDKVEEYYASRKARAGADFGNVPLAVKAWRNFKSYIEVRCG